MGELVNIDNLSFRYVEAERWAIREVRLQISEGDVVILAGPSGCGKSTLLRSINGLIPHMYPGDYSGSVTVSGSRVDGTSMGTLARKVGLLFQNPENQIFMFSVERDIAFGLENLSVSRNEIRRRVDETMSLLGIGELAHRAPYELSDGQKQRVALAGVIAMEPNLIILDEPTSLLDPKTASELVVLIERLNRELGITFIIVEHRLDLLTRIASRMVVMSDGRVVMNGTPSDVLADEKVLEYGVVVPAVSRLYSYLLKDGMSFGQVPLTPEELSKELASA